MQLSNQVRATTLTNVSRTGTFQAWDDLSNYGGDPEEPVVAGSIHEAPTDFAEVTHLEDSGVPDATPILGVLIECVHGREYQENNNTMDDVINVVHNGAVIATTHRPSDYNGVRQPSHLWQNHSGNSSQWLVDLRGKGLTGLDVKDASFGFQISAQKHGNSGGIDCSIHDVRAHFLT